MTRDVTNTVYGAKTEVTEADGLRTTFVAWRRGGPLVVGRKRESRKAVMKRAAGAGWEGCRFVVYKGYMRRSELAMQRSSQQREDMNRAAGKS